MAYLSTALVPFGSVFDSFHHTNKGPTNLTWCHEPATRGRVEWLIICSGLFGCLPLWTSRMKQLPRQQKLIAMITEALPSGATQRGHPDPALSVYAKETLRIPKYIQWSNQEADECHRNMELLVINMQPVVRTVIFHQVEASCLSELSANGLAAVSPCVYVYVCIGFVWSRVGWGGAHMSNHVCREVLCLIQKPGNVASFSPPALRGLFDMRKRSVWQKPSYPLCSCFSLSAVYSSPSLSVLSSSFFSSSQRSKAAAAFWGEYYSASAEKSA